MSAQASHRDRRQREEIQRAILAVREQVLAAEADLSQRMSWALRELSRRDPEAVRSFLAEHDDVLSARVKREVRNKLTTGLKNPK